MWHFNTLSLSHGWNWKDHKYISKSKVNGKWVYNYGETDRFTQIKRDEDALAREKLNKVASNIKSKISPTQRRNDLNAAVAKRNSEITNAYLKTKYATQIANAKKAETERRIAGSKANSRNAQDAREAAIQKSVRAEIQRQNAKKVEANRKRDGSITNVASAQNSREAAIKKSVETTAALNLQRQQANAKQAESEHKAKSIKADQYARDKEAYAKRYLQGEKTEGERSDTLKKLNTVIDKYFDEIDKYSEYSDGLIEDKPDVAAVRKEVQDTFDAAKNNGLWNQLSEAQRKNYEDYFKTVDEEYELRKQAHNKGKKLTDSDYYDMTTKNQVHTDKYLVGEKAEGEKQDAYKRRQEVRNHYAEKSADTLKKFNSKPVDNATPNKPEENTNSMTLKELSDFIKKDISDRASATSKDAEEFRKEYVKALKANDLDSFEDYYKEYLKKYGKNVAERQLWLGYNEFLGKKLI